MEVLLRGIITQGSASHDFLLTMISLIFSIAIGIIVVCIVFAFRFLRYAIPLAMIGSWVTYIVYKKRIPFQMIVRWSLYHNMILFLFNGFGLLLWYFPFSLLVYEADALVPFLIWQPTTWSIIFEESLDTFTQPTGLFHSTGQVAMLYMILLISAVIAATFTSLHLLSKRWPEYRKNIFFHLLVLTCGEFVILLYHFYRFSP